MKTLVRLVVCAALIAVAAPTRAADAITGVLNPYFRIQSALADDRIDTLKTDSLLVAQEAGGLGAAGKPIEAAATALSEAGDIGTAREAFGRLSDAVIAYAETTKTSPGADVARVYCPMVKKSWLQKNGEIRNPYFGKAMPTCGEKKKVG